jgi:hypothetical protein
VGDTSSMTIDSHLAIWHNVWRFNQAAGMQASATYGSTASETRLLELHPLLHEAKGYIAGLEHEHTVPRPAAMQRAGQDSNLRPRD